MSAAGISWVLSTLNAGPAKRSWQPGQTHTFPSQPNTSLCLGSLCPTSQTPAVSLPQMVPVPCPGWLLSVYAKDVLTRLPELKARVTSIYGSILKMDSTKKVTKKLAGEAAGTAAWVTDVGNEFGQVLMCILMASEGDGLFPLCSGLVERYRRAGEAPPKVLYVDRDCRSATGKGKAAALFAEWDQLAVKLDVWHFMRRFAVEVTTECHPLYSVFMKNLSACIFE